MKHLIKVFFVLIVVSFLLAPFSALEAADKKAEKAEKHCCPMSEKKIDKEKAKFKVEYKGKTYYFCCEEGKAAFEKDPEKYLKEGKDKTSCCEEKVVYVCPMKQCSVKTDKPGKCPKCGMDLKKVVEYAHANDKDHMHEHKH